MRWKNDREKQLGVALGFVLEGTSRGARIVNLDFDDKDTNHDAPRQARVRPASMAEVKMWRELSRG